MDADSAMFYLSARVVAYVHWLIACVPDYTPPAGRVVAATTDVTRYSTLRVAALAQIGWLASLDKVARRDDRVWCYTSGTGVPNNGVVGMYLEFMAAKPTNRVLESFVYMVGGSAIRVYEPFAVAANDIAPLAAYPPAAPRFIAHIPAPVWKSLDELYALRAWSAQNQLPDTSQRAHDWLLNVLRETDALQHVESRRLSPRLPV